jgi:hypothetical protein
VLEAETFGDRKMVLKATELKITCSNKHQALCEAIVSHLFRIGYTYGSCLARSLKQPPPLADSIVFHHRRARKQHMSTHQADKAMRTPVDPALRWPLLASSRQEWPAADHPSDYRPAAQTRQKGRQAKAQALFNAHPSHLADSRGMLARGMLAREVTANPSRHCCYVCKHIATASAALRAQQQPGTCMA